MTRRGRRAPDLQAMTEEPISTLIELMAGAGKPILTVGMPQRDRTR